MWWYLNMRSARTSESNSANKLFSSVKALRGLYQHTERNEKRKRDTKKRKKQEKHGNN
jgi:hypothetical protein